MGNFMTFWLVSDPRSDGFPQWAADNPLWAYQDLGPQQIGVIAAIGALLLIGIYILNLKYGADRD
jgi:hypothetical protein